MEFFSLLPPTLFRYVFLCRYHRVAIFIDVVVGVAFAVFDGNIVTVIVISDAVSLSLSLNFILEYILYVILSLPDSIFELYYRKREKSNGISNISSQVAGTRESLCTCQLIWAIIYYKYMFVCISVFVGLSHTRKGKKVEFIPMLEFQIWVCETVAAEY